jgi:hypothetical protein
MISLFSENFLPLPGKKKGRNLAVTAFRIVVVWERPLGPDPAGNEIQVAGTPYGMTMRHWITSFA